MRRLMQLLSVMGAALFCSINIEAVEPAIPPEGVPQEDWIMTFRNYKHFSNELTRVVKIVRTDTTIYVKGIFEDYPDSWLKGRMNGKQFKLDEEQLLKPGEKPVYAMCGYVNYDGDGGNTYSWSSDTFLYDYACTYTINKDDNYIDAKVAYPSGSIYPAIWWFEDMPTSELMYLEGSDDFTGSYGGIPERDYPVKISFTKGTEIPANGSSFSKEYSKDGNSQFTELAESTTPDTAPIEAAVVPASVPQGLPEESWTMIYDDYRYQAYGKPQYQNLTRPVTVSITDKEFYVKGVFPKYPEAWIKGTINGSEIKFDKAQLMADGGDNSSTSNVYAMCGYALKSFIYMSQRDVNSWWRIEFKNDSDCTFTLSQDKKSISSAVTDYPYHLICPPVTAFWCNSDVPKERLSYKEDIIGDFGSPEKFPELFYPVNIRFAKTGGGGVNVMTEEASAIDATTYDLQGRAVNPDNLRPGIYIRAGKKIIVR